MSKYDLLIAAMGSKPLFNDKVKNGRVLKWYADTMGATLVERQLAGKAKMNALKHIPYVQKVVIRNSTVSGGRFMGDEWVSYTDDDYDKICVYIDEI